MLLNFDRTLNGNELYYWEDLLQKSSIDSIFAIHVNAVKGYVIKLHLVLPA